MEPKNIKSFEFFKEPISFIERRTISQNAFYEELRGAEMYVFWIKSNKVWILLGDMLNSLLQDKNKGYNLIQERPDGGVTINFDKMLISTLADSYEIKFDPKPIN